MSNANVSRNEVCNVLVDHAICELFDRSVGFL